MTALRDAIGSRDPLPPPPALPAVPPPPARVYAPRPEKSAFAAQAARHTTALLGIGHVGSRIAELSRGLFNMQVLACDPYLTAAQIARLNRCHEAPVGGNRKHRALSGVAQLAQR
jgi:hypothetical protein